MLDHFTWARGVPAARVGRLTTNEATMVATWRCGNDVRRIIQVTLLFHSPLKTYLFHESFFPVVSLLSWTAFTDYHLDRFFWATRFLFLVSSLLFVFDTVRWIKLALMSAF